MFHLDGVIQSVRTIQAHAWENRESYASNRIGSHQGDTIVQHLPRDPFNSEILARLSPLQITFIAIDTMVSETLRGVIRIVGGIVSLNWKIIRDGLIDLVSVAVQLIVLPIIALISLFSPKEATWVGLKIIDSLHRDNPEAISKFAQLILGTLLGIVSIPLSALRSALRAPIELLNGQISNVIFSIFCIIKEPIASIGRVFNADYYRKLHEYGPRAFSSSPGIMKKALWYVPGL